MSHSKRQFGMMFAMAIVAVILAYLAFVVLYAFPLVTDTPR